MDFVDRSEARIRMRSMPGWPIHWAVSKLTLSYVILSGNGNDLVAFLQNVPALPTPALPGRESRRSIMPVQIETARLLHNFLAAAKTLVDHSRGVSRQCLSTDARDRYKNIVKTAIVDCPPRAFVHDLRNYFLHVSIPVIVTNVEIAGGGSSMSLVRKRLLDHDRWNAEVRNFLESGAGDVPIGPLVRSYWKASLDVTASLIDAIVLEGKEELTELYELADAVAQAVDRDGLCADDPLAERFGVDSANTALQRAASASR